MIRLIRCNISRISSSTSSSNNNSSLGRINGVLSKIIKVRSKISGGLSKAIKDINRINSRLNTLRQLRIIREVIIGNFGKKAE